jgi:predicted metal-dependent hydrolase
VIESNGPSRISRKGHTILELQVSKRAGRRGCEQILLGWYRKNLKALILPLIEKWEAKIGTKVESWGVRRMKTKWVVATVLIGESG